MADKILIVDDSLTDLTEKRSSSTNDKTRYVTPSELVNEGNGGYTYAEVDILQGVAATSGILGMGTVGVEILPDLPNTQYYDIDYISLEFTYGTTQYTLADTEPIYIGQHSSFAVFEARLITQATNTYAVAKDMKWVYDSDVSVEALVNSSNTISSDSAVKMFTWGGADPTAGDGTILVKIWYKVKTFGTEL